MLRVVTECPASRIRTASLHMGEAFLVVSTVAILRLAALGVVDTISLSVTWSARAAFAFEENHCNIVGVV